MDQTTARPSQPPTNLRRGMKLYRVKDGAIIQDETRSFLFETDWDKLINRGDLFRYLHGLLDNSRLPSVDGDFRDQILAPIVSQEVWAAGVTYYRSRTARIEESQDAGGGDFYDRVYTAERPELFFKATPHRVARSGAKVRFRPRFRVERARTGTCTHGNARRKDCRIHDRKRYEFARYRGGEPALPATGKGL